MDFSGTWSDPGNGRLCFGISCFTTGYAGLPGKCTCNDGYSGTVTYINGQTKGCALCPVGYWTVAGNGKYCAPIPLYTGYSGSVPGQYVCAPGFSGVVQYNNAIGTLSGCAPCSPGRYDKNKSFLKNIFLLLIIMAYYITLKLYEYKPGAA